MYSLDTQKLVHFCQYTKTLSEIKLLTTDFVSSATRKWIVHLLITSKLTNQRSPSWYLQSVLMPYFCHLRRILKSHKTVIHVNLCIALLAANVLLLIGSASTENEVSSHTKTEYEHYGTFNDKKNERVTPQMQLEIFYVLHPCQILNLFFFESYAIRHSCRRKFFNVVSLSGLLMDLRFYALFSS